MHHSVDARTSWQRGGLPVSLCDLWCCDVFTLISCDRPDAFVQITRRCLKFWLLRCFLQICCSSSSVGWFTVHSALAVVYDKRSKCITAIHMNYYDTMPEAQYACLKALLVTSILSLYEFAVKTNLRRQYIFGTQSQLYYRYNWVVSISIISGAE